MPPKQAAKPAAKAAKPAAKPAAKVDAVAKPDATKPDATKPATPKQDKSSDEVKAVIILLFTKCKGQTYLLLGLESYEKWGPPGGGIEEKEDYRKAADRIFLDEVGYPMTKILHEESFRFRNAMVYMIHTDDCIETKLGPKIRKTPQQELLDLMHVTVSDIYKFLDKPTVKQPLRPIFISMMIEHKKEVDSFVAKLK